MKLSVSRVLLPFALASLAAACAAPHEETSAQDDDLSSITARSRTLKFGGTVYVSANAADWQILDAIKHQTQSAFGALRTANVGVNSRELGDVDPKTFVKSKVTVVDTGKTNDLGTQMLRVTYTYTDNALVPTSMARRSAVSLGLLAGDYGSQTSRILKECTENQAHDREFESSIWYVFNPSLSSCKTAMADEQKKIDADRKKLTDPKQVALSETTRLYVPMTAALTGDKTNKSLSYPEYDRLYAGGVQKDKLVIGMVSGMMADWAAGEHHDTIDDEGYAMWFEGLRAIFAARPEMKIASIAPNEDLTSFALGTKTYSGIKFEDIVAMELDGTGFPAGVTSTADKRALRVAIGNKLAKHWVTFEAPLHVAIGSAAAKNFTVVLNSYFGAEEDPTPHKHAIKTSDVFVYNGHSYIGYGPLDPSHFSASDFPSSYQIMFVNGCVSYNYYEKDYFPLKPGGTKNLELVTNGLESWVDGSGPAMGRFVGTLVDGKQESYTNLLKAAQFTGYGYSWGQDALRVVDGELDNLYDPAKMPITVTP
jgi:hypothetical protein